MNTELLRKVRDAIAADDSSFEQNVWWQGVGDYPLCRLPQILDATGDFCGSPGCIAGHAVSVVGPAMAAEAAEAIGSENIQDIATELLELDEDEAFCLFSNRWSYDKGAKLDAGLYSYSPSISDVLAVLDRIIEAGWIDLSWDADTFAPSHWEE